MQSRIIQGTFRPGRPRSRATAGQAKSAGGHAASAAVTAIEGTGFSLASTAGRPLPDGLRHSLQTALGADFADVRVHEGPQADAIGAVAFTVGTDIYFAPGRYQPQTVAGRQLLGHELAHVLQQRAGRVRNPTGAGLAIVQDRALEAEADRLGHRAAAASLPIQAPLPPRPVAAVAAGVGAPVGSAVQAKAAPPRPAGPPAPAFAPPSAGQPKPAAGAGGHRITIGTYLHRAPGLPAEAAGHTFVAIEAPGGRRETWGFSPADRSFDPRAGLGQAKTGVPGRVHRDDGGFAKPGVVTRSYAVSAEQARAALCEVAECRARPPQFSFAGRDCGAFAADVLRAAGLATTAGSLRPGPLQYSLRAGGTGSTVGRTVRPAIGPAVQARSASVVQRSVPQPVFIEPNVDSPADRVCAELFQAGQGWQNTIWNNAPFRAAKLEAAGETRNALRQRVLIAVNDAPSRLTADPQTLANQTGVVIRQKLLAVIDNGGSDLVSRAVEIRNMKAKKSNAKKSEKAAAWSALSEDLIRKEAEINDKSQLFTELVQEFETWVGNHRKLAATTGVDLLIKAMNEDQPVDTLRQSAQEALDAQKCAQKKVWLIYLNLWPGDAADVIYPLVRAQNQALHQPEIHRTAAKDGARNPGPLQDNDTPAAVATRLFVQNIEWDSQNHVTMGGLGIRAHVYWGGHQTAEVQGGWQNLDQRHRQDLTNAMNAWKGEVHQSLQAVINTAGAVLNQHR